MSTKIEWATHTENPAVGCEPCGPACNRCYAPGFARRLSCNPATSEVDRASYAATVDRRGWTGEVSLFPGRLANLRKGKKPRRVFVGSMTDLFHKKVPRDFVAAIFGVMAATPQHKFMLLTKRPDRASEWFRWMDHDQQIRMHEHVKHWMGYDNPDRPAVNESRWPLPNVWMGTTIWDQPSADRNVPILLTIPAAVRYVSIEPMLGPVQLGHMDAEKAGHPEYCWINSLTGRHTDMGRPCPPVPHLDWVICGAETGPGKRQMDNAWARALQHQCSVAEVPFLFKKDSRGQRKINGRTWEQFPGGDC